MMASVLVMKDLGHWGRIPGKLAVGGVCKRLSYTGAAVCA